MILLLMRILEFQAAAAAAAAAVMVRIEKSQDTLTKTNKNI